MTLFGVGVLHCRRDRFSRCCCSWKYWVSADRGPPFQRSHTDLSGPMGIWSPHAECAPWERHVGKPEHSRPSVLWLTPSGFPGKDGKESACNGRDLGSIPGSGRSPGEGNGNPLQYSCLENPRGGGAWWAAVQGVSKGRTRLSTWAQQTAFCPQLRGHLLQDTRAGVPLSPNVCVSRSFVFTDNVGITLDMSVLWLLLVKLLVPQSHPRLFWGKEAWGEGRITYLQQVRRTVGIFYQGSSAVQSLRCVRLCNPTDCSTPGFLVHPQLPELAQTHVHRVDDAIQPSHPLSSPSPFAMAVSPQRAKLRKFKTKGTCYLWKDLSREELKIEWGQRLKEPKLYSIEVWRMDFIPSSIWVCEDLSF